MGISGEMAIGTDPGQDVQVVEDSDPSNFGFCVGGGRRPVETCMYSLLYSPL